MKHKKLTVNPAGPAKLYQYQPLPGWEVLGTVSRGGIDTGALVRNQRTGIYCQANAGSLRSLSQRAGLGGNGKRIMRYMATLGYSVSKRCSYGWRRTGKVGIGRRRFLRRLDRTPLRPLLAYERRQPCTCGGCGRFLPNGGDRHHCEET